MSAPEMTTDDDQTEPFDHWFGVPHWDWLTCEVSGTSPNPVTYSGPYGGWWDGWFHHCVCGATADWTARPEDGGVISEHAKGIASTIARLRELPAEQRADIARFLDG